MSKRWRIVFGKLHLSMLLNPKGLPQDHLDSVQSEICNRIPCHVYHAYTYVIYIMPIAKFPLLSNTELLINTWWQDILTRISLSTAWQRPSGQNVLLSSIYRQLCIVPQVTFRCQHQRNMSLYSMPPLIMCNFSAFLIQVCYQILLSSILSDWCENQTTDRIAHPWIWLCSLSA